MVLQKGKALAQAGEHAEGQYIDLEETERLQVVLVPFDDRPVLHGRVLDRHHLVEWAACHDEAADMLGEMPGKADQFAGQVEHQSQPR